MLSEKGRAERSTATGEELAETREDKNIGNCESQRKQEMKVKRCWRNDTIQVSQCPSGYIKVERM